MAQLGTIAELSMFAALAPACALDEATDDPAASTAASQVGTLCPIFLCGDNAATAGDGLIFDELHLYGQRNYAGVRIAGASRPSPEGGMEPVQLEVDQQFFYTIDQHGHERRGHDLLGTVIELEHKRGTFELQFAGFNDSSLAFQAGISEELPVYELRVRRPGEPDFKHLACNAPIAPDPLWTSIPHHAVVYRGDRYHPTERRLITGEDTEDWIFLGCAGSGSAKMHLHRHTRAGRYFYAGQREVLYPTSAAQRTALMKAITADYCGDGRGTFTETGHPLTYAADQAWWRPVDFTVPTSVRSIEGIWREDGLVCLDEPRLYPRAFVTTKCGRRFPSCGDVSTWRGRGYVMTANP